MSAIPWNTTTGKPFTEERIRQMRAAQVASQTPKLEEARKIWESTPTPLYNEFMSKRKATEPGPYNKYLSEDQTLFWSYVKRLKESYPKCNVNVTPMVSGPGSGKVAQSFNSSGGQNYYSKFRNAEKACQVNQLYDRKIKEKSGKYIYKVTELPEFQTVENLEYYLRMKEKEQQILEQNRLNREAKEAERRRKEEARRFAAVKQGNLLGLNRKEEENLLSFGPTKEGLASRANELKNLFKGGRKTRKSKKSRKTRKYNRKY